MKKGCKALVIKLNKYIDDELPASERQDIEKHLESCHECRQTLSELQLTDKTEPFSHFPATTGTDLESI
jgi:anti-sigma factor RsiW